jgi:phage terminase small subunit
MSDKKLTPKQKLFCKEYQKDFNATRSAIAAGYSKKTAKQMGTENLAKPYLAEYLKQNMQKQADKVYLSVEMVLKDLIEVKSRCMQQVPVLDKDGNETGVWKFEHTGANKSLELLGKHLTMFTDKIETKHDVTGDLKKVVEQYLVVGDL